MQKRGRERDYGGETEGNESQRGFCLLKGYLRQLLHLSQVSTHPAEAAQHRVCVLSVYPVCLCVCVPVCVLTPFIADAFLNDLF